MENDIPVNMLIRTNDIISGYISKIYSESKNTELPNSLKTADITPIHDENDKTIKKHYRPISILPSLSKLYEGNMNEQISYVDKICSPYLFRYRKGRRTQHYPLVMIEM